MKNLIKKFPLSKNELTETEILVLEKLEKVAGLVSKIYEQQVNDEYLGANFYPHDVTKNEILNAAKIDPLILNPFTVVEKGDEALMAIPYHEKYKDTIKNIVSLIREAAFISDNKDFSKRLEVQADALEYGSYEAADIYWLSMKPYKIDIIIGPIERYEDRLFFKKTCYGVSIGIIDEEATAEAIKIRDMLLAIKKKTFSLSQHVINTNIQVRVDQAFIMSGLDSRAMFAGIYLPNDPNLIERYGSEVIILNNVVEDNFEKTHSPIYRKMFEKEFQKQYDRELLIKASQRLILIKELSENLIKYHDAEKRLGSSYSIIYEMASYVTAVKSAGLLLLKEVITQRELEAIMIMFLCRAFDSFRIEKDIKSMVHYSQGYRIAINYFFQNGALIEKNGISWVNFTKMFMALNELANSLDQILAFGDTEDAERLINEYTSNI